ncbi:unnamed protein product [Discosporangium mesarthrocarpum]
MSTLAFVKELCEGHYLSMQEHLREQKGNRKTFNIVNEAVLLLCAAVENQSTLEEMEDLELSIFVSSLTFLTEAAQGPCPQNQLAIADSDAVEVELWDVNSLTCA